MSVQSASIHAKSPFAACLLTAMIATGCGDDDRAGPTDLGPSPTGDSGPGIDLGPGVDLGPGGDDGGPPDLGGPPPDPTIVTNLSGAEFVNEWADGTDLGLRITSFAITQEESFSEPGERFVKLLGEVQNLSGATICQSRAEVSVWAGTRQVFVPDFPPEMLYSRGHRWVSISASPLIISCIGAGETAYLYTNGTYPMETLSAITEVRFNWYATAGATAVPFEEAPTITGAAVDPFSTGSYRFEGTITNDSIQLHSPAAYVMVRGSAGHYVDQSFSSTFMEFPPFDTHDYETLSIDRVPTDYDLFVSFSESDLTDLSRYAAMASSGALPSGVTDALRATARANRADFEATRLRWQRHIDRAPLLETD
jgi:hypothetical protein